MSYQGVRIILMDYLKIVFRTEYWVFCWRNDGKFKGEGTHREDTWATKRYEKEQ